MLGLYWYIYKALTINNMARIICVLQWFSIMAGPAVFPRLTGCSSAFSSVWSDWDILRSWSSHLGLTPLQPSWQQSLMTLNLNIEQFSPCLSVLPFYKWGKSLCLFLPADRKLEPDCRAGLYYQGSSQSHHGQTGSLGDHSHGVNTEESRAARTRQHIVFWQTELEIQRTLDFRVQ